MRTWETPEIIDLAIAQTAHGGTPSTNFDEMWFDEKGALVVNFTDSKES